MIKLGLSIPISDETKDDELPPLADSVDDEQMNKMEEIDWGKIDKS